MAPEGSEDGNLYPDQSGDAHPSQVVLDVHLCRYLARVIREVYEWWRNEVIIPCSLKRNKLPFTVFVRALKRLQVLLKECCDPDTWTRVAALPGSGNEAVVLDILHDLRFSQSWAEILKNSSPLSNPLDVNDPLASRDRDAVRERRSWDRNRITNLLSNSSTASQAVPLSQDLRKKLKISSTRTDKPSSSSTTISRSDSCEISQKISLFAINNKLRDGEHLGAGAYGAVCATEWQGLPCAMKIFNSVENDDSFKREAVILGDLRHPNVVQLYGFTRGKSKPRIILELMRTDLRALLDSKVEKVQHSPFQITYSSGHHLPNCQRLEISARPRECASRCQVFQYPHLSILPPLFGKKGLYRGEARGLRSRQSQANELHIGSSNKERWHNSLEGTGVVRGA